MWFPYTLIALLIVTSVMLTLLILLHRGKGGGLSSMFGGGVTSSLSGSSVAERNLDLFTVLGGHRLVCLHCRLRPVAAGRDRGVLIAAISVPAISVRGLRYPAGKR